MVPAHAGLIPYIMTIYTAQAYVPRAGAWIETMTPPVLHAAERH